MGRYHKQSYSCEVVENAEGKLHYRLEDGREFKSPSAAGMAITGHACDGWVFWSVQTEETVRLESGSQINRRLTSATEANQTDGICNRRTAPTADKTASKKTGVFLVPNQKGVPEGQIRWFCRECGKSFIASAVEITGDLPGKASGQLKLPEKRIMTSKQAPIHWELACYAPLAITIPPPLAEVMIGNHYECGAIWSGNAIGNGIDLPDHYQWR